MKPLYSGAQLSRRDIPIETCHYGIGARFRVLKNQNVWVGVDIARGPEDTNWYIQVGQAR